MKNDVKIITLFAALGSTAGSMLMPYIPLYGQEIGMPIALIGYLVFVYYISEMTARIPMGSMTGVMGDNTVISAGGAFFFISSVLYLLSDAIWPFIFTAQIFLALGFSVTWVTIPSYVTRAGGSLPVFTFSIGLGWLFGPLIGGLVRDVLSMYHLFLVYFAMSIGICILAFMFLKSRTQNYNKSKNIRRNLNFKKGRYWLEKILNSSLESFKKSYVIFGSNKEVFIATTISFVVFMAFAIFNSLIPLHLESVGFTSFMIGIFTATNTAASSFVRLSSDRIINRGGIYNSLFLGTLIVGISIFILAFLANAKALILLSVISGLGLGIFHPVVFDLIAKGTNKEDRGVGMGLRGTVGTAGSAIGVVIFTNIADFSSIPISIAIFGIFMSIFTILMIVLYSD